MNAEQNEIENPRRPGRPKREEVMATERRRRKGTATHKLAIPEAIQKRHPDMEFRWVRDLGARMQQVTQSDDWDKVPNVDPIHGGTGEAGTGYKMHLLMKPKAFLEADRQEKLDVLKERERQATALPNAKNATEAGHEMYSVPGNKI
jgi:hypothetical protein